MNTTDLSPTTAKAVNQTDEKTSSDYRYDLEQLLADGYSIRIHPQGFSMYPLFIPGRDEAVIEPIGSKSLRRNDVVLYRRDSGILVLHRIFKINSEGVWLVGDNQTEIEGPLRADQMKGLLCAAIRNDREIPTSSPVYRFLTSFWLFLRPIRPVFWKLSRLIRKLHG